MKFFIFMCCTAHLVTGISSRLRRTTPMSPALRSDDADERQVAKFAEIIDFVNSAPNNEGRRNYFRRHGRSKRQDSRRLNEVMAAMYGFAQRKEFEEFGEVMAEIEEKIRHDITEDPNVLMEYGVRPKTTYKGEILDTENTPFAASKYSTAILEVTDGYPKVTFHTNATVTSHDNATEHVRAQDDVQELITDETIYRRSFIHDKDDEKPIIGKKKHEKQHSKPKVKEEHHDASQATYKTDKFEKKTQNNKPSRKKDKAQLDKIKADKHSSKGSVTNKEDNKEHRSTNIIYSREKLNVDSIRPKDETDDKINNKEGGDTNENSGKDKNQKQKDKSWDKNENNVSSAVKKTLKVENKTHNNRDHMDQYSMYSHNEKSEYSSKHSKKSHDKIDKYDTKTTDKYHDTRGERKSQWIKVDTQKYNKESLRDNNKDTLSKKESDLDKTNYEWFNKEKVKVQNDDRLSKKQKEWDNDDRSNKKEKNWDVNDDKLKDWDNDDISIKKEKDWDIEDRWIKKEKNWDIEDRWYKKEKDWDIEDRWNKKENYRDKTDGRSGKIEKPRDKDDERWTKKRGSKKGKDFDIMEYEWNKRHEEYDKYENDAKSDDDNHDRNEKNLKEMYNEHKKRDSEFKNRYNDWTKRGNEGNKNWDRTYDRKESGYKKSFERVDLERVARHDRYRVVDRVDSGSSINDGY